jgi:hypothetical protein
MDDAMTDGQADPPELDLVVDLNGEDESGLPWAFLDEARDPELIGKAHGSPLAKATFAP